MGASEDFIFIINGLPFVRLKGHVSLSWNVRRMNKRYVGVNEQTKVSIEEASDAFLLAGFQAEKIENGFHFWNEENDVRIENGNVFVNGEPFLTESEKEAAKRQKKREVVESAKRTLAACKMPDNTLLICKTNQMMQALAGKKKKE